MLDIEMKIQDRVPNVSRVNLAAEKSAQNRIPKTKNRRIIPSKVGNRKAGTLDMFGRDIIVIGASVGAVDALPRLIGRLPTDLCPPLFLSFFIALPRGRDFCPRSIARPRKDASAHRVQTNSNHELGMTATIKHGVQYQDAIPADIWQTRPGPLAEFVHKEWKEWKEENAEKTSDLRDLETWLKSL